MEQIRSTTSKRKWKQLTEKETLKIWLPSGSENG